MINIRHSKSSKKKWDNTTAKHWQENLRPPWRPSQEDTGNYKQGIRMVKKGIKNILILGATPELRILAGQLKAKVWLADQSLRMLKEMGKLIPLPYLQKEKYLIGDWCVLQGPVRINFDIILGDLVLRLINLKKQTAFFKKINHLLSPDGLFVTRIHFVKKSLVRISSGKIIDQSFSLLHPDTSSRAIEVKNLLISRILDKNYLLDNSEVIRKKARLDIKNYLVSHSRLSPNQRWILKDALNRFGKWGLAEFYSSSRKEIENNLKKFFEIKKELTANDYEDVRHFPVYVLKPKLKNSKRYE